MAEKGKFWTKVKVEVVAGLVVLIIIEIFTGGWFSSALWKAGKAIGGFLSYPIALPLWAIVLLPIFGAGALFGLQVLLRRRRKKDGVPFHAYTRGRIFDIDWVWEWVGGEIKIRHGLCPTCEYEVEMGHIGGGLTTSEARCVHCGFSKPFNWPANYVLKQVIKEIHRRIRTGEWKEEETKRLT